MYEHILGNMYLLAKTIAILYVLYLELIKKIDLPTIVLVLFAVGGIGLGINHLFHAKSYDPIYNHEYHNLIVGVFSVFLLFRKLKK